MTESAESRGRALAVLLIGACVIGVAPILVRLSETGPAAAGFWRLLFALPLLAVITQRSGGGIQAPPKLAIFAGVAFALDLGFWHYGIANTSVAKATVFSNLTPILVTAFAWIFLMQRPGRLFLLAVALATAGAWTMALTKGAGSTGVNPPLGDALSAATAIWYSIYFLVVSQARRSLSASRIMFWSTLAGTPLMLLAALGLGEQILPLGLAGWVACVGLGVMHVAGQGSIAWALGRLPAATASVVVLIQPVVAAVLGWWLFDERLGTWPAVGAAVALTGVVLAQWASRPKAVVA